MAVRSSFLGLSSIMRGGEKVRAKKRKKSESSSSSESGLPFKWSTCIVDARQ